MVVTWTKTKYRYPLSPRFFPVSILQVSNRCDELPIYRRFLQSRIREQNENAISHGRGVAVSRNLNRSRALVYFCGGICGW